MLEQFTYCPILYARNAELKAFTLLPIETKSKIFPLFVSRPIPNSIELERTWERIGEAVGQGVYGLTLDDLWVPPKKHLKSHEQFQALLSNENGYEKYYETIEKLPNATPCLQGNFELDNVNLQIAHAARLQKDFILRLTWEKHKNSGHIILNHLLDLKIPFVLYIDLGWNLNLFNRQIWASTLLGIVTSKVTVEQKAEGSAPIVETVICGSSFPNEFAAVATASTPIQERQIYSIYEKKYNLLKLKYGDWGSARMPDEENRIMRPSPRIDLPTVSEWISFKKSSDSSYTGIAKRILENPNWDDRIEIWGTNSIRWTAEGEEGAILGQQVAASVRMNIHMHMQANYGGELSMKDGAEIVSDL